MLPRRIMEHGCAFRFPTIEEAVGDLLQKPKRPQNKLQGATGPPASASCCRITSFMTAMNASADLGK